MLNNIKKILVVRTDRFGEFVLNLPVISALKNAYPHANITVMANPTVLELINNHPDIDGLISYDENKENGIIKLLKLIFKVKNFKFDLVVILNPKRAHNLMAFFARIPKRLGYDRKWGFLLNYKIKDKKFLGKKHEIDYNLDLLKAIGIASNSKKDISIPVSEKNEYYVENFIKDNNLTDKLLIAVHPWSSNKEKRWPINNYAILINKILNKIDSKIMIIGGKDEIEEANQFCKQFESVINVTGRVSLGQTLSLLKRCSLLISNDSGPIHLASAVDTTVLALFGPSNPVRWRPLGNNNIVIHKNSLSAINPEEVFSAALKILER